MTLQALAPSAMPGAATPDTISDALDLLCREHEQAQALADECRRHAHAALPDPDARVRAEQLCSLLRHLSEIEEGVFYPVARAALETPQLVDLAALEHATARQIIRQLRVADPAEPRFEALLLALSDCVERHVRHEQCELFPRVRLTAVDLRALAARMRECCPQMRLPVTH
jgi:hypothetical protein